MGPQVAHTSAQLSYGIRASHNCLLSLDNVLSQLTGFREHFTLCHQFFTRGIIGKATNEQPDEKYRGRGPEGSGAQELLYPWSWTPCLPGMWMPSTTQKQSEPAA